MKKVLRDKKSKQWRTPGLNSRKAICERSRAAGRKGRKWKAMWEGELRARWQWWRWSDQGCALRERKKKARQESLIPRVVMRLTELSWTKRSCWVREGHVSCRRVVGTMETRDRIAMITGTGAARTSWWRWARVRTVE